MKWTCLGRLVERIKALAKVRFVEYGAGSALLLPTFGVFLQAAAFNVQRFTAYFASEGCVS